MNTTALEMDDLGDKDSRLDITAASTEEDAFALTINAHGLNAEQMQDGGSPFLPPPINDVTYAETRISILPALDSQS
jgi:hypothetical protein